MTELSLNRAMLLALILFVSCGRAILTSSSADTISSEPDRETSIQETVEAIKERAAARNSSFKIASQEELESLVASNLEDDNLTLRNLSGLVGDVMARTPDDLAHVLPPVLVKLLSARNIDPGLVLRAITLNLGKHSDFFISEAIASIVAMLVNNQMPVELARQIRQAFEYSVNNQIHAFSGIARELDSYISRHGNDRGLPVVVAIVPARHTNENLAGPNTLNPDLNDLVDSIESCAFDPNQAFLFDNGQGGEPSSSIVCSVRYNDGVAIWMASP